MIFALAAFAADPPTDHVLSEPGYAFCQDAGRGGPEVLQWCPLLEGLPPDRCPGLRATCEAGVPPGPEPAGCNRESAERAADRLAGQPDAPQAEAPELSLGDWWKAAESFVRWFAAFLVALVVLLLLRFAWITFGVPKVRATPTKTSAVADVAAPDVDDLPDAPVADVLAAARAALAAGRTGEAVVLARAAALKRLHEQGVVVVHRTRTDREYVRAARRAGGDADALSILARLREAWLFGRNPIPVEAAREALAAAERIVAVGIAAFLLAFDADAADPRYGPDGDAALPRVLAAWGNVVTWRLRSLDDVGPETDVLVLDLFSVAPSDDQLLHLRSWVEGGGVLWVAGRPTVGFDELGDVVVADCMVELDPAFEGLATPGVLPETSVWSVASAPVLWCGSGAPVQAVHVGEGVVVAFADATWLRNGAFVHPGTERFVGDLLNTGRIVDAWPTEDPVRIELATLAAAESSSDDGGSNNPFRSMANARLLPFVLQLLAAFGVLALWRGWPFSPLREPQDTGRRGFADHVRALGTRLSRARASGVAARALARYWHGRLGVSGVVLAAERMGRSRVEAQDFAREVESRASGEAANQGEADHVFMEELWKITRGRAS